MPNPPSSSIKETLIVSGFASLALLILSWPGFRYFFSGETFTYLRIYNAHGKNLWEAAFSRMDGMFFRPGFFLSDLWWHFVFPPDPMVYHIRNFLFCVLNLFLLYRVLLKFVQSRSARIIALGIFTASKIHMTSIGYINVYEAAILLMTILLAVLFWIRYLEKRRSVDYVLALSVCTVSVYSKDNGFMVVGIVAVMTAALAINTGNLEEQIRYWIIRYIPFVFISASYILLRYILTGPINPNNPVYSPRLSFSVAAWQTKAFLATVGNFSLTDPSFMGEKGLSSALAGKSEILEISLCAATWLLILFTIWRARSSWRLLLVTAAWICFYLTPIFLIRNHQVYYHQEPLVGVVVLIGICLDGAKRPLVVFWCLVVAMIGINAFISNRISYYAWQYTADRAEIVKPIVAEYKDHPPSQIVFVSAPKALGFWTFAIGGPLVPHLLGSADTRVEVVDPTAVISPDAQVYHLPE